MKITNVSCEQFAGIRNKNIAFEDGINVVYGKNESGKSTLVNLISRTLFQKAKLDGRTDKDFVSTCFPTQKKGSNIESDCADGKVSFEIDKEIYILSKEWGVEAMCKLSTPDGIIRDQKKIDAVLKDILIYGEGVYMDMLLSSQKDSRMSLQTLLDDAKKTNAKQEIVDVVTKAFVENDDVSIEAMEKAIDDIIQTIAGAHWDFEREQPTRKVGRWSTGVGEILKAYYAFEDARNITIEIEKLEKEVDEILVNYNIIDKETVKLENEYNKFNEYAGLLAINNERQKSIDRLESELRKYTDVLNRWPKNKKYLEKAKELQIEKDNKDIEEKYIEVNSLYEKLESLLKENNDTICPTMDEITSIKSKQKNISKLENKLCGMNLNATINMFNNHNIKVRTLRTNEEINVKAGMVSITEAVSIIIDDVMEMQLSPVDIDIEQIEREIKENKQYIDRVFKKYNVKNIDELEKAYIKINDTLKMIDTLRERINIKLGNVTFDELKKQMNDITKSLKTKEDIQRKILTICSDGDIQKFIIATETTIENYIKEYKSIETLESKVKDINIELAKVKDSINKVDNIPEEYKNIINPEEYLQKLQIELKEKQKIREIALTSKTATSSKLETYKDNLTSDPVEDELHAKKVFEEMKETLKHWIHIKEVFIKQKEKMSNNPMLDISKKFEEYLDIISDGRVKSNFTKPDKVSMEIYSKDRIVDYNILSEGTKETVFLAFRLAVLDHLFPQGGGIIVFDDPFTDMDEERTAKSIELIKEASKRHQILFLTCKKELINKIDGNLLELS